MDMQRVINAQEALIEVFPDLQSAVTITIAQRAIGAIVNGRANGVDPYWDVAAAVENVTPKAYAPILSYQAAALYIMEADRLWQTAMGELPTGGDER